MKLDMSYQNKRIDRNLNTSKESSIMFDANDIQRIGNIKSPTNAGSTNRYSMAS